MSLPPLDETEHTIHPGWYLTYALINLVLGLLLVGLILLMGHCMQEDDPLSSMATPRIHDGPYRPQAWSVFNLAASSPPVFIRNVRDFP